MAFDFLLNTRLIALYAAALATILALLRIYEHFFNRSILKFEIIDFSKNIFKEEQHKEVPGTYFEAAVHIRNTGHVGTVIHTLQLENTTKDKTQEVRELQNVDIRCPPNVLITDNFIFYTENYIESIFPYTLIISDSSGKTHRIKLGDV